MEISREVNFVEERVNAHLPPQALVGVVMEYHGVTAVDIYPHITDEVADEVQSHLNVDVTTTVIQYVMGDDYNIFSPTLTRVRVVGDPLECCLRYRLLDLPDNFIRIVRITQILRNRTDFQEVNALDMMMANVSFQNQFDDEKEQLTVIQIKHKINTQFLANQIPEFSPIC